MYKIEAYTHTHGCHRQTIKSTTLYLSSSSSFTIYLLKLFYSIYEVLSLAGAKAYIGVTFFSFRL